MSETNGTELATHHHPAIKRRDFLTAGCLAGAAVVAGQGTARAKHFIRRQAWPFPFQFAPHIGSFRHSAGTDDWDQLQFMADSGFRCVEDNGLVARSFSFQRKLGKELKRLHMSMGSFVGVANYGAPTFAAGNHTLSANVLRDVRKAIVIAKRVGGQYFTVIPGRTAERLSARQQFRNALETTKHTAGMCEQAGVTMLLEPLDINANNGRSSMFLDSPDLAFELCQRVGSPHCKMLFDIPAQHLRCNDLLAKLNQVWSEVGYMQIGDQPGRKEPGTGTINFPALMQFFEKRNYRGPIGMEHGNSLPGAEGERAVIDAYRQLTSSF